MKYLICMLLLSVMNNPLLAQNNHVGNTTISQGSLNISNSNGVGDAIFNAEGQAGRNLSLSSYKSVQGELITRMGINYAINGGDGVTQYAIDGAKKSPFIELNAENGSIALYGEHGTGGNWRFSTATSKLGLLVDMNGNVGIGTSSPTSILEIAGNSSNVPIVRIKGENDLNPTLRLNEGGNWQGGFMKYIPVSNSFVIGAHDANNKSETDDLLAIAINRTNGDVGIGTTSPNQKLNVFDGNISLKVASNSNTQGLLFQNSGSSYVWAIQRTGVSSADLQFNGGASSDPNSLATRVVFKNNGNVGIGTSTPDSKLTVKGVIHAEEVKVDLSVPGPDYVFEADYSLTSLEDTKVYIEQNKHLPGIPSSDEMQQNGVNLLEMNMKLLEKVEELTLHLIEQNKQLLEQKNRIEILEKKGN
jgi:hypothetical protein